MSDHVESELRRLREKHKCSVVIEHRHVFYDFRDVPHQEFRVCFVLEEPISSTKPTLEEAISEVELELSKRSPEAKAELMRKKAAELLKQAEELSPSKHEQPANQD
jgi:hypothetical protein